MLSALIFVAMTANAWDQAIVQTKLRLIEEADQIATKLCEIWTRYGTSEKMPRWIIARLGGERAGMVSRKHDAYVKEVIGEIIQNFHQIVPEDSKYTENALYTEYSQLFREQLIERLDQYKKVSAK